MFSRNRLMTTMNLSVYIQAFVGCGEFTQLNPSTCSEAQWGKASGGDRRLSNRKLRLTKAWNNKHGGGALLLTKQTTRIAFRL
jgi:hypothetical protein